MQLKINEKNHYFIGFLNKKKILKKYEKSILLSFGTAEHNKTRITKEIESIILSKRFQIFC